MEEFDPLADNMWLKFFVLWLASLINPMIMALTLVTSAIIGIFDFTSPQIVSPKNFLVPVYFIISIVYLILLLKLSIYLVRSFTSKLDEIAIQYAFLAAHKYFILWSPLTFTILVGHNEEKVVSFLLYEAAPIFFLITCPLFIISFIRKMKRLNPTK